VDRDAGAIASLRSVPGVSAAVADLESGSWPFRGRRFDAVVVCNYLWRPLFPGIIDALAPAGVLLYETFAVGNEKYGKPSNPDFLLRPGELLTVLQERCRVIAFEDLYVNEPNPAMVQRICAVAHPRPEPNA
jgi:SAM-dependent methyltransferase